MGITKQKNNQEYIVLVPAYKPDERLIKLVRDLKNKLFRVLVVDDGSGYSFAPVFEECKELGAIVVTHTINMGKGRAIKTGIKEILSTKESVMGVVTADADGQHTPDDILKIVEAMVRTPDNLVLGVRSFSGQVPFKSRIGNMITRVVYRMASGISVKDTQTGLRGLPIQILNDMFVIEGERYEYEMNVLLCLKELRIRVTEVPIETIYIDDNKGSHFNPIKDACRIYSVIFKHIFRKKER